MISAYLKAKQPILVNANLSHLSVKFYNPSLLATPPLEHNSSNNMNTVANVNNFIKMGLEATNFWLFVGPPWLFPGVSQEK